MKLFYVVVMAALLGGCASMNTKDQYPESCEHNAWGGNTREDIDFIKVETSKKSEFYELTPLKIFSGIESANINDTRLTLTMVDRGLFEQYSAPVIDTMRQVQYEAHRFTGTFTPVGVFVWMFNPKSMNDYTFGCTSRNLVNSEPDASKKVKTGRSKWRDITKSHRILVSGLNKDYEYDIGDSRVIDLNSALLNTDLSKNTTLKVTCLDCDLLGAEEQNLFKGSSASINLSSDLSAIKTSLIQSQKAMFVEEEKNKIGQAILNKEESERKSLQAKENLEAKMKKQRNAENLHAPATTGRSWNNKSLQDAARSPANDPLSIRN